jgi:hypothetical protein
MGAPPTSEAQSQPVCQTSRERPKFATSPVKLIEHRHPFGVAPNAPLADEYLRVVAHLIGHLRGKDAVRSGLLAHFWKIAPTLPQERVLEVAKEAEDPDLLLCWWSADALGELLQVTQDEREALRIRTFGCTGMTKAKRARLAKERRRERDRVRNAIRLRSPEGKRESLLKLKPWDHAQISRRTFYRLQETERARLVEKARAAEIERGTTFLTS